MATHAAILVKESDRQVMNDIATVVKMLDSTSGKLTTAASFQDVISQMNAAQPAIVILEVADLDQGVKEVAQLVSQFPLATIMVTATEKNPDWILRLIRAGAGEYLTKPIVAAELMAALQKITRLQIQHCDQNLKRGTVIAAYNPSGGVGTTTIAVNLATSLAEQREKVALVDLNLCCGDVTAFLDLSPRYTLSSVAARRGQVDANFLRSVIVRHPVGVDVLCAPVELGETDRIAPEQLRDVMTVLRSMYDYIVVDTGGQLTGCNRETFEAADLIMFVTLLNLPGLRNAKRYLGAIHNEISASGKVRLIVNRHSPRDDIKIADAEKVLNTKTYLTVPNAYVDVKTSINKGVPLGTACPGSPVRKAMIDLSGQITMESAQRNR